jgi:hypothetical protein
MQVKLARIFSGGEKGVAKKRGRGGNSFPPHPFFFPPRPSVPFWLLPREARQSFGILFKKGSHCVQ